MEDQTEETTPVEIETAEAADRDYIGTATYSPEDNKLRLYPFARLSKDDYERVKLYGFKWAPKQELFVAPMWTPSREDFLIRVCGEIGDEDTSLVDRAEAKAERLENLSERKQAEADRAHKAVAAIADNIPLGQPILIGHHSEKHARKDAERIQNGMRKAVNAWKASEYWTERAAGALHHAKYKELPAVRYRRIKGLRIRQAQAREVPHRGRAGPARLGQSGRGAGRRETNAHGPGRVQSALPLYSGAQGRRPARLRPEARRLRRIDQRLPESLCAAHDGRGFGGCAQSVRVPGQHRTRIERWIDHYENRIAYERAMLDEQGGLKGEQFEYQVGGQILRRHGLWFPILKVNKRGGVVQSVTVAGHFASTVSVDEIRDYRPPAEGEAEKAKAIMDKGPMCNYPGDGFKHMTTAEWKAKKMSDVSQSIIHKATETHGKHRTRATYGGHWSTVAVYLTDAKRIDPPAAPLITPEPVKFDRIRETTDEQDIAAETARIQASNDARAIRDAAAAPFKQLEESLKAGVQVVAAPQLFPTPPSTGARMVQEAGIERGTRTRTERRNREHPQGIPGSAPER